MIDTQSQVQMNDILKMSALPTQIQPRMPFQCQTEQVLISLTKRSKNIQSTHLFQKVDKQAKRTYELCSDVLNFAAKTKYPSATKLMPTYSFTESVSKIKSHIN